MKVNAAAAFILAGMALGLSTTQQDNRLRKAVAVAAALAVALIGGITLAEYVFDADLGIDQLAIADNQPEDWTLYPGRPGPATAASFLLLGIALLLLPSEQLVAKRLVRILVLLVFSASGITIVGFMYGIRSPYSLRPFFWMALPTAATFIIVCIGVGCFRPNFGLMIRLSGSHNFGRVLANKLMPIAVGMPLILGWLHLLGNRQGFYSFEFAQASYAVTMILFLSTLVLWSARWLNAVDEQRTRAEEQMRIHQAALAHALRLTTIGEIAAEMAHELNQPLSAIHNYARGTIRRLSSGPHDVTELIEITRLIADESMRASKIIKRLNLHAKKWEPQRGIVDVNTAAIHATQLTAIEAQSHGIAISVNCAPLLSNVIGDAIQLEQVLVNLLLNGIDALDRCDLSRSLLVETKAACGSSVEVLVADNGCGLPHEHFDRVFEPFFTTKPNGLGMGLAISRSIIEAHGGRLWAEPNPNGGATFRFTLPAAQE